MTAATTGRRKLAFFLLLFAAALCLRICFAIARPNIYYPDEIFQTLEPAHRLAFGYGVITWEWRLGVRSWVFPAFLAGIMRATAWMGPGSSGYLFAITAVLSLLSLIAVWFGYAWARRASGNMAAVIAAVTCAFYFPLVYFAPKAFYEQVSGMVLLPGLYLGVYGEKIAERKRLFWAGLFCGLAACLRIQLLPALLFAVAYFCYPRWRERAAPAAAGFLAPVFAFGAVDWITWGHPWQSFLAYFWNNVIAGPGKEFSSEPWYWYLLALFVLLGPAMFLLPHGSRRSPFLAIFCAIVVVAHSFIPHKELRFMIPIVAPAVTLAAIGIVDLLDEMKRGVPFLIHPKWMATTGMAVLLLSSVLLAGLCSNWYKAGWGLPAFDRLSRDPAVCGVGLYHATWLKSGGYAHLHRNIPIIMLDNSAALESHAPQFNALVAPQDSTAIPAGFRQSKCWAGICLLKRGGGCAATAASDGLNAYLKR